MKKRKVISLILAVIMTISISFIYTQNIYAANAKSIINSAKLTPMPTGYTDIDNKINSIIAEGRSKTNDMYSLVKWLYEYCIYNTEYGYEYGGQAYMENKAYGYVSPFPDGLVSEAVGPLFYGRGVCNNYAAEFMLITRALGFESYYFVGETRKAGGGYTGHAWCEIKINGVNYVFDTQVEDNVAATKGKIIYLYFCKTEKEMAERYIWNWSSINSIIKSIGSEPKLNSLEDYLDNDNMKHLRAVDFGDFKNKISTILNNGDNEEYIIILNGNMNRDDVKNYLDSISTKTYRGSDISTVLRDKYMVKGNYESLKVNTEYLMLDNNQGVDVVDFMAEYTPEENQYIYDEDDPVNNLKIPDNLDSIETKDDAVNAVENFVDALTDDEKNNSNVIDIALLYSQEAMTEANKLVTEEYDIVIDDTIMAKSITCDNNDVTSVIKNKGIPLPRTINTQMSVFLPSDKKVTVNNTSSNGKAKSIKCHTEYADVTIPANEGVKVSVENKGNKVAVDFNSDKKTNVVKVSFPGLTKDASKNYAAFDEKGNVLGGKYNPVTRELEVKIKESGVFTVQNNAKSFSDIKAKSQEVQEAIELLASKGIINGTSISEFSPDSTITRAEVTSLVCRIISKYDPNEDGGFDDVTKSNWYFGAAGSGKKEGIINGYANNTFRGEYVIPKIQIVSIAARVLKKEMNYYSPENTSAALREFSDMNTIADWGRGDIALANEANLIVKRKDAAFEPNEEMTRADAAVILKRLYDKIW